MTGHVIVCGFGHVGYRAAHLLRRLRIETVVLYDQAPAEWVREAEAAGCRCLQGDARSTELLQRAEASSARALIAATNRDMVNISIALDARRLNPALHIVARLFDQDLAGHVRRGLGIRAAFSTSALAAPIFMAAALGEDVVECFSLDDQPFVIAEAGAGRKGRKPADAPAATVDDTMGFPFACVEKGGVRPVASGDRPTSGDGPTLIVRNASSSGVRRGPPRPHESLLGRAWLAMTLVPVALRVVLLSLLSLSVISVFVFRVGLGLSPVDAIYFVATTITTVGYGDIHLHEAPPALKIYGVVLMLSGAALLATLVGIVTDLMVSARFREMFSVVPRPRGSHVIVVGGGNLGLRLVAALQGAEQQVAVVVDDAQDPARGLLRRRAHVIVGDARQRGTLLDAGVKQARAVVAVHEDDLLNLGATLLAKELNPGISSVARVFDSTLATRLQDTLSIDKVLSLSAVAAPAMVAACLFDGVVEAFEWRSRLIVGRRAAEVEIAPPEGAILLASLWLRGRRIERAGAEHASAGATALDFLAVPLDPPRTSRPE